MSIKLLSIGCTTNPQQIEVVEFGLNAKWAEQVEVKLSVAYCFSIVPVCLCWFQLIEIGENLGLILDSVVVV